MRFSFVMFGGLGFLHLGVMDSYVYGLVFLRVVVSNSYVWEVGIFTFRG